MKQYLIILVSILLIPFYQTIAQVHTSYLWHMQQPNYWPETSLWHPYHYQTVRESYELKTSGNAHNIYSDGKSHPLNDLQEIFSKDDRVAAYQYRLKDAVQSISGYSEAGAQVNYSGCLIENVNSLAENGQWGYSLAWKQNFKEARSWKTTGGQPRMDITGFTFHHALSPLLSDEVLRKQIQAHRLIYSETFGNSPQYSKGYWPAECAFSERIIKVLVEEGFEWSIIANSHLSRTLSDYPLNYGTNGCNIDPPNPADIIPRQGNNWWNGQIDGRGGTFAAPFSYQAHKAKYVDPENGNEYKITVVPMADLLSYKDGFSQMGTGDIDNYIAPYSDPSQPCMVLLAHDGDNAWGGGYDYYNNAVPNFCGAAAAKGYVPTTIQQFLNDHPVPETDIVHVEDGAWVNAANDWGHPQFINWMWPLYDPSDYSFNPNGWTEDVRNWAVLVAAENYVITADELSGGSDIQQIVYPGSSSSKAERAWHHLLPAYTSGYMYYGMALDMEVKQSLAGNLAIGFAKEVLNAHPNEDNTPPSVFIPQRYPYNPGGIGFGPTYGYQQHTNSSDFHVWTLAYDINGIQSAVLRYRCDKDGLNPLTNNENETYAGGAGVGSWSSVPMDTKLFPAGNITGNPDVDFFIMPEAIANIYWAEISGLKDTLVDYFVEMSDSKGNMVRTAIQHVYIGNESGGGGGNERISWSPENPTKDDIITVTVTDANEDSWLHWGLNNQGSNWTLPNQLYWPAGSQQHSGGTAVQSPFMDDDGDEVFTVEIGPFNNPVQIVEQIAFVIWYGGDHWDNNNGSDYHIPVLQNVGYDNIPKDEFLMNIFPNPSPNRAWLQLLGHPDAILQVEIYNMAGKCVYTAEHATGLIQIDVQDFTSGLYQVVAIEKTSGQKQSKALIVQ